MKTNIKLCAILLLLCIILGGFAVSCDNLNKDEQNTDGDTEQISETENGADSESESVSEEAETLGHADEMGDDDFVKVEWGNTSN